MKNYNNYCYWKYFRKYHELTIFNISLIPLAINKIQLSYEFEQYLFNLLKYNLLIIKFY